MIFLYAHGTQRLVRYHKAIENGAVIIDAKPEMVFETPVSAVIDGHSGMGQLVSHYAMEIALKKAKEVGMSFVRASRRAPRKTPPKYAENRTRSTQVRYVFYSTGSIRSSALQWSARDRCIAYHCSCSAIS